MKLGLNLFVGQLIATVGLLILICIGVVLSFYYTNHSVLTNYGDLMQEEKEKNRLNQIDMLVSLARQAEKGFYAEQNPEDAKMVLVNLEKALDISRQLDIDEKIPHQNYENKKQYFQNLKEIKTRIKQYHSLFSQSLKLWETRGFSRASGVGLQLRESAYNGLRTRLGLYNTQALLAQMYRLRWLEHEYYLYGSSYIAKMKTVIDVFKEQLQQANLNPELSQEIEKQLQAYQTELDKIERSKGTKVSHKGLEKKAHALLTILSEHSIGDFAILYRTLLYYEMEYRELGHQEKHVLGVNLTVKNLQKRVLKANIDAIEKQQLEQALKNYAKAFNQLIQLDKEITQLKETITSLSLQLTPHIQSAMAHEAQAMEIIQLRTAQDNQRNTLVNISITLMMLLVVVSLVYWMIRRLGGKIGRIGHNLEQISNGNLQISSQIPPENKRDELDWITHHIDIVAKSLSASMQSLTSRNKELEVVSSKLAKYLSPQVYSSIFSGQQAVHIQSQRKRLTIFFSDIVGFTHTTDTMESEELTNLLNDYLNEMSKIALEYGGTIDKFIGDAMMIFFGDPESRGEKEDSIACVSMALAMRKRLKELRQIWEQDMGFTQPFKIRIGIATGYCTVGNFGSEERMDYTIIGGYVNLASRMEHHAKPNQILISHETYALVKDQMNCEAQDTIQVKGIAQAVRTYQVVDSVVESQSTGLQLKETGQGYSVNIDAEKLDIEGRKKLAGNLLRMAKKLVQG